MVRNNVMGLLYYLIINIIVFSITTFIVDYLYKMKLTYLEFNIEPPVFLIAICMFIVTGRFLLKNQGSKSKNIFSVCLITIIGIIIAIQDFISSARINPFGLYWAYIYPINSLLVDKIGVYWYGMERFLLNCMFTFIPSVFMWLGIQWRENKIMRIGNTK
jgi:hypothetical protein